MNKKERLLKKQKFDSILLEDKLFMYDISVDEVKGEYGGREYHGLTYSATDREGNKVGKPFKSSVFGKEAGVAALERRMHKAAEWEKPHREVAAATVG